jgi:hypothetical protein
MVCGIGFGSTAVAAETTDGHIGAVIAKPPTRADVPMNWRRVIARSQKWGWPLYPSGIGITNSRGICIGILLCTA